MMLHWVTICGLTISIMDMANAPRYTSNYTPLYILLIIILKMRCGEFPPPLLKGGGKAYGHDVGGKTCTDGDKVGSTCKMLCPSTHPGWDQNRAQTRSHLESIFTKFRKSSLVTLSSLLFLTFASYFSRNLTKLI